MLSTKERACIVYLLLLQLLMEHNNNSGGVGEKVVGFLWGKIYN